MRGKLMSGLRVMAVLLVLSSAISASESTVVEDFDKPHDYSYGDFAKEAVRTDNGVLIIEAAGGKGGATRKMGMDLSASGDRTLAIRARARSGNEAKLIRVFFEDASKARRTFEFDMNGAGTEFKEIVARNAMPLKPSESEKPFDSSSITMMQVQGSWKPERVAIEIDRILLLPPDGKMLAQREKNLAEISAAEEKRKAAEMAKADKIRQTLSAGTHHPADGARCVHVSAAAPDIIAVTLVEREVVKEGQKPMQESKAATIKEEGKDLIPVWTRDGVAMAKKNRSVVENGQRTAYYVEPFGSWIPTVWREHLLGSPLQKEVLDVPAAYSISSGDDPAFKDAVEPAAVYRKSKPCDQDLVNNEKSYQHTIYLKLPGPMKEGASYGINFKALATRDGSVTYSHKPREVRSESVHVNQIGYRPDDGFKRAYLSLWLGSGGAQKFSVNSFEIMDDASGRTVHSGSIVESFPVERPEKLKIEKNFVFTDVYYMDFHDFKTPGRYRIHVPGIGCSHPFVISEDDSWAKAFRSSMKGFLSHRSGIELGPPFSEYRRPRNMHPADGFKIFELVSTRLEGEANTVLGDLSKMLGNPPDASKLKTNPDAWGGYMDAGDWDRRSQHLDVSYEMLELHQTNPEFFSKFKLSLPPGEADDMIPDIVNEALWNIDFYARLQAEDGGVRGGVESVEHPRMGEASWQETLLLGVFAPDPVSSYAFAACSAKVARILAGVDKALAEKYRKKAILAWDWAGKNGDRVVSEIISRSPSVKADKMGDDLRMERMRAASELYALTLEDGYHQAFKDACSKIDPSNISNIEMGALFNYAMMDAKQSDPSLRESARTSILAAADVAVGFGKGNAFNIHTRAPGIPMMGYLGYYSVPETITGPILPRAYKLTGERKYLDAAIAAAHFSAGANPLNMTFTVGVGTEFPRNPLHIDSRVTGQKAPEGITVYGPMDSQTEWGFNTWVHTWHLGDMVPNSRAWPAAEWYVDLWLWPAMCEYTVHQTFRPTAYYWGFLASRSGKTTK